MHRYHCGCETCDWHSGYPFRVQTDSSCSGEVISSVFRLRHDDDDVVWRERMDELQDAALDADAEPGLSAGFHVHVMPPDDGLNQSRALWAFIRMENYLRKLAAGRFMEQRVMNNTVRQTLRTEFIHNGYMEGFDWYGDRYGERRISYRQIQDELDPSDFERFIDDLFVTHLDMDRHSNLNVRTSAGTFEFRLWNSTRSAWRMELNVLLSAAMVDPAVVDRVIDMPVADNLGAGVEDFITLLDDCGYGRAAELASRQWTYLGERAMNAPSQFVLL